MVSTTKMINECLAIHMIYLLSRVKWVIYIVHKDRLNPLNLRMAWLGPSIHSRILPYDTHCFKFLNLSSWTRSFNKNKSHLNVLIFVLFSASFVLVLVIGWAVQMIATPTPLNMTEFCLIMADIALNFSTFSWENSALLWPILL